MKQRNLSAEVGSLVVFALCVFFLVALGSYHNDDPSFLMHGAGAIRNLCGALGAHLAAVLLHAFGMGAFLFPAALFFVAASLHRADRLDEGLLKSLGVLAGMAVAVVALSVFAALQWKYWSYGGSVLLTGGALGAWVARALQVYLNTVGASIAALLVFSVALVVSTPIRLARFGGIVLTLIARVGGRLIRVVSGYALYLLGIAAVRLSQLVQAGAKAGAHKVVDKISDMRANRIENARLARLTATTPPVTSVAPVETSEAFEAAEPVESIESAEAADVVEQTAAPLASVSAVSKSAVVAASGDIRILPHEKPAFGTEASTAKPSAPRRSKVGQWKLPTVEFLKKVPKIESAIDKERLKANAAILVQKFADFGIDGEVTAVRPGPVITLYEFKPGPGVKVSKIAALADDLSMALSAQSVRILAPLPGKAVVGIEIPSDQREIVYLREFIQHSDFDGNKHAIPVVMGKDIGGQTVLSDLARMPHLLAAGQTGSGKSVFMNGLICSLFYRFTPDELRMILVDPKFIEFRAYQDIPHLLLPVVDDPKQASTALKWAVREMDRRYRILAKIGARNLASFNQKVEEMGSAVIRDLLVADEESETGTREWAAGSDWMEAFEPDEQGVPRVGKLPYIVVIIDELADLMMIARKEVEISIARIAQKARAAGIHLVIATQRPSTDVITGLIKANLPSRVSFQLASYVDSKTILDRAGAERLLGQGDMLFVPPGSSQPVRLHGAYLDDDEIHKITSFLRSQGKPVYRDEILLAEEEDDEDFEGQEADEKFDDAVDLVKRSGHASASFIQRHLKVGYNRAARMIEEMESRGIVGPAEGSRPREVLVR